MKATAKDLRFNSGKLLDSVNRGEEVIITVRGKPRAKLVPYQGKIKKNIPHGLFGIWKDNNMLRNVDEYVRQLRKGRF